MPEYLLIDEPGRSLKKKDRGLRADAGQVVYLFRIGDHRNRNSRLSESRY